MFKIWQHILDELYLWGGIMYLHHNIAPDK